MPPYAPFPETRLTLVDGLIHLDRARHYLLGFYGGSPRDANDREAAEKVLLRLEQQILAELGVSAAVPPEVLSPARGPT